MTELFYPLCFNQDTYLITHVINCGFHPSFLGQISICKLKTLSSLFTSKYAELIIFYRVWKHNILLLQGLLMQHVIILFTKM